MTCLRKKNITRKSNYRDLRNELCFQLFLTHRPTKTANIIDEIAKLVAPLGANSKDCTILGLEQMLVICKIFKETIFFLNRYAVLSKKKIIFVAELI